MFVISLYLFFNWILLLSPGHLTFSSFHDLHFFFFSLLHQMTQAQLFVFLETVNTQLERKHGFSFHLVWGAFINPLKYLSKASRALKCIISAVALFPVIFFSLFLQLVLFSLVILLLLTYIYTFQTWLLFPPFSMPLLVFHRVISFVV